MTHRVLLSQTEWLSALHDFSRSAFRLELQPQYAVPGEMELAEAWLAGQQVDPETDPGLADWLQRVREHVAAGKTVTRVRVHEDPPNSYQRWERWLGAWNTAAGERLLYLTRPRAVEVGLLPAAGTNDWWLQDDERLLVMRYLAGRRIGAEMITDPDSVAQARAWRDLAVRHGVDDATAHLR